MDLRKMRAELERDERRMKKAYRCTAGKLTIGIGHNLDDKGLSDAAIDFIFEEDLRDAMRDLSVFIPWWSSVLNEVRQRVLVNMVFNMGISRVLMFKLALSHMRNGEWARAAAEMRNSDWFKQVGARAERLATMMETGMEPAPQ